MFLFYVEQFSLLTFLRKCAIIILGGDLVFYIRIRGGTTFISSASNFYYLCDNCLRWFRSDIVVSIYSYPDSVLIATVSSGKINFHKMGCV